jgi:hypothetical protein
MRIGKKNSNNSKEQDKTQDQSARGAAHQPQKSNP